MKSVRYYYIVSGMAAEIGARMAIPAGEMSGFDAEEYHTEWHMNRGFMEPLQRAMNGEWFSEDFVMGGKQGTEARKIWNFIIMKYRGGKEFADSPEWKKFVKGAVDNPSDQRFIKMVEYARDALGTDFTELFRPGFLKGGLQFDQTSWRANVAILQEIRSKMLQLRAEGKLGPNDILDNQALGLQLLVADSDGLKMNIMKKIMEREPSIFLQILGKDMDAIIMRLGIAPNSKEYRQFKSALIIAQQKLWTTDLKYKNVDLANAGQFDEIVGSTLRSMGITDAGLHDKYHKIIVEMQTYLNGTKDGVPRILNLAKHDWPMTLTLSDFNINDADFMKIGMYSMERRINDFLGVNTAMATMFDLMYDADFFSPGDYKETLKKIKEFRKAINSYDGPVTAEKASKAMLQLFVELNRNRALWTVGWIPGGVTLAKTIAEWDFRWLGPLKKIPGLKDHAPWVEWVDHKLIHWPHSVGEAISHSVAYTGAHGNAWSEFKINEVLDEADKMGLFTENRDFIKDLKSEFRATLGWRALALFRRYGWVVLAATIAVAATESLEDEKKKSH